MPEPVQTTIYGGTEPVRAPSAPAIAQWAGGNWADVAPRLFTAPQTIRGQLAIPTEKEEP